MVELLAVIVILGILGTIAVPVVTSIVDRVRNQYYYTLEGNVEIAGRDYYTQYRSKRPEAVAYTSKVDIATLMDEKFIEEVIESKSGKRCDGFVIAIREEDDKIDYHACITCGDEYKSKSEYCGSSYDPDNNDSIYTVEAPNPYRSYLNEKLTLKKGKVYQRGKLYKSDLLPKDTSTVKTNKEGSYPLVYTYENAQDTTTVTIYELKPPTVTLYKVNDSGTNLGRYNGEWTNQNVKQNLNSQYATSYQYAFSSNATTWSTLVNNSTLKTNMNQRRYVRAKDVDGHVSKTSYYNIKIDKIKPTVKYTAGTRYDNQDLDVKITVSDSGTVSSGVKSFKYCTTTSSKCTPSITKTGSSATIKLTTHSSTNKICVIAYDNAGNQSNVICSSNYKIDKTPTCPVITSNISKETWTNQVVKLTVTPTADTKNWTWYTNTDGGAYKEWSTKTGKQIVTLSAEGVRQGKIVVTNDAGISKTCYTDKYYVDTTAPSCPSFKANIAKETWSNKQLELQVSPSSDTTKYDYYVWEPSRNDYIKYYTKTAGFTDNVGGEGVRQAKVVVYDRANNTRECYSDKYYIDKTAPTCPTITADVDERTWTNKTVTLTITPTADTKNWTWYTNTNGGAYTQYSTVTGKKPVTFSGEGVRQGKIEVRDEAGNSRTCYTGQYYVDKTAPIVIFEFGRDWTPAHKYCYFPVTRTVSSRSPILSIKWSGNGIKDCDCYNSLDCFKTCTVKADTDAGNRYCITLSATNVAGTTSVTRCYDLINADSCPE